ncbi:MAG TPA: hypothetical protein VJ723_07055 [Candidatus Angelobacter sp.]|nr:hypothetical protein [Candidatus Angelobacter sp.]
MTAKTGWTIRNGLLKVCRPITLILLSMALISTARATSLHDEIQKLYGFHPASLTHEQRKVKSDEMDRFWAKAEADKGKYIPELRQELTDLGNPPFFLFDGSMLLLKMSDTSTDRKIAVNAIAHCDLDDVQSSEYFKWVQRLAAQGENTTTAALRILEDSKFQVFVPQHSLTLGQNYALIYMLLPVDQELWLPTAIDRLKIEKDPTAQRSLLLLLWYAQDVRSDKAIHVFSLDMAKPAQPRDDARKLEERTSKILATVHSKDGASEAELRKQRQALMRGVSDEALYELDDLTVKLIASRKH